MTVSTRRIPTPSGALFWMAPLSSTLRVDARAEFFAKPSTVDELRVVLDSPVCRGSVPRVIGMGANLVFTRAVIPGLVLHTGALRGVTIDGTRVTAGAGTSLPQLIAETVSRGLAGLEVMGGIPGTLGGAIAQNAGGKWGEIGPLVRSVKLINAEGEIEERDDVAFSYRHSGLKGTVIVEATLELDPGYDPVLLRDRYREIMAEKAAKQPLASASAGCVFKNPPQMAAAKLIDEAGWKGRQVGKAMVSPVHANFVVNQGGATPEEITTLIYEVQRDIEERCGVSLEREVEFW